ncbi:MAG: DUF2169 domain-containing protein [Polyangiaceae bacterium]
MDIASLCPLPVGVVSWQSPGRVLSVIVKATFAIAKDGVVTLAPVQEPLSLDRKSPLGNDDELHYASDFAPLKARADVLLVGHAYADVALPSIRARLVVDELDKSFYAVAAQPSAYIPLLAGYLRKAPNAGAEVVRVGPLAPWSATRAAFGNAAVISGDGPLSMPLTSHFDFRFFNVAPPDQQLDLLRATARVTLEGLLAGVPKLSFALPGIVPKVFHLAEGLEGGAHRADPVALRCDTLWIHTDRATFSLGWRGVLVEQEGRSSSACLVTTMQSRGEEQPWRQVRTQLDKATRQRAAEPAALRERPPPSQAESPSSDKRIHEVSGQQGGEPPSQAPASPTRSMVMGGTAAPDPALAERLRALREQRPPPSSLPGLRRDQAALREAAIRDIAHLSRPLLDDATLDSPYASSSSAIDEPTRESPYRVVGAREGGAKAARPVRPDMAPVVDRPAHEPDRLPESERTVTTIHNPLLAAAAVQREADAAASSLIAAVDAIAISEPPPPAERPSTGAKSPGGASMDPPTQAKPPRVPFPIIDDPTLTMHHEGHSAVDPDGEADKKPDG